MKGFIAAAGTSYVDVGSASTVAINTLFNASFGWSSASAIAATNGTLSSADNTLVLPTVVKLMFAQPAYFQNTSNIWIAKFSYYPQRLINAEVQAFSK